MAADAHSHLPWSPKLSRWAYEALLEYNLKGSPNKEIAIFPRWWLEKIESLHQEKSIDFNFIGALMIDDQTYSNRRWVIDYATDKFTEKSHLQFTDKRTKTLHQKLGNFDYTQNRKGFVPKELPVSERNYFDQFYYKILCRSKFTLCPAGDSNWSMRFYEAIACKSIPILQSEDCFRTEKESSLGYTFITVNQPATYDKEIAEKNYAIFKDNQTLCKVQYLTGT